MPHYLVPVIIFVTQPSYIFSLLRRTKERKKKRERGGGGGGGWAAANLTEVDTRGLNNQHKC